MVAGNLQIIDTDNPDVFAFRRVKGRDRLRVVVNLTGQPARFTLPGAKPATLPGWGWTLSEIQANSGK